MLLQMKQFGRENLIYFYKIINYFRDFSIRRWQGAFVTSLWTKVLGDSVKKVKNVAVIVCHFGAEI